MAEIETLSVNKLEAILNEIDENEKKSQEKHALDTFDYMAYLDELDNMNTWFSSEKYKYITSIKQCVASYDINLPDVIAEIIVLSVILLPGCYSITGLTFLNRNEYDLYAEYANTETGYITDKTDHGIAYKRKLPHMNMQHVENTTASLWLDENGSICGFRCIWVHNSKGNLIMEQQFCILDGCWTLNGEILITFEYFDDIQDEFEGFALDIQNQCHIDGRWSNEDGMNGKFRWIVNNIESFRFDYIANHTYINVSTNDTELLIHNKTFDIDVTTAVVLTIKFTEENNVLQIYEKYDDKHTVIGYGKWYTNGKLLFKNVKYVYDALILSFNGYWNDTKIIGRLCVYRDNKSFDESDGSGFRLEHTHDENENENMSFNQMIVVSNIVA